MAETIVMNVNPVKLEEIDIDETEENPWSVEDVSVFLNYCCPECDYKNQDLNVFSEHALHNHFNATALFGVENYDDKLLFDFNKTEEEFDEDNKGVDHVISIGRRMMNLVLNFEYVFVLICFQRTLKSDLKEVQFTQNFLF